MGASTRLFEPARHEAIGGMNWDEGQARREIAQIAGSVGQAREADGFWCCDNDMRGSLYMGAAGITWAASELASRGYDIDVSCFQVPELGEGVGVWKEYRVYFEEFGVPVSQSYLAGPVGALMLLWKTSQDASLLDRLDFLIGDNQSHPWMENLWGAPSTMLAAGHLYRATGQERFANHIRNGAAGMWDRLEVSNSGDCRLWNIPLYGTSLKFLGAGHGFVGNVFPILRHLELFDAPDQEKWIKLAIETVTTNALVEDGLTNWLPVVDNAPELPDKILLHQCHGAPGFVIGLMSLYGNGHEEFDQLLLGAGELVWQAGPLKKYPGLCHGTPGNGYVFLKLWQATGDEKWLTRARAFAMASIRQRSRRIEAGEPTDSSLWEGDMGLALYLADCIDRRSDFPNLDYF